MENFSRSILQFLKLFVIYQRTTFVCFCDRRFLESRQMDEWMLECPNEWMRRMGMWNWSLRGLHFDACSAFPKTSKRRSPNSRTRSRRVWEHNLGNLGVEIDLSNVLNSRGCDLMRLWEFCCDLTDGITGCITFGEPGGQTCRGFRCLALIRLFVLRSGILHSSLRDTAVSVWGMFRTASFRIQNLPFTRTDLRHHHYSKAWWTVMMAAHDATMPQVYKNRFGKVQAHTIAW